jgi:hypothetical protein
VHVLAPGRYRCVIGKLGYEMVLEEFTVEEGKLTRLEFTLEARP